MFCNQCGTKIENDSAAFCPICGSKIGVEKPEIPNGYTLDPESGLYYIKTTKSSKKLGILIGVIALVAIGIVSVSAFKFHWFSSDANETPEIITPLAAEPTGTTAPTKPVEVTSVPMKELQSEPTTTTAATNPKMVTIGDTEYSISETELYLSFKNLTNNDLEALKLTRKYRH